MRKAMLIVVFTQLGASCGACPAGEKGLVLDLGGKVSMRLVRIRSGEFLMGSGEAESFRRGNEGPRRKVRITKDFFMGRCEVTRGQFAAFVRDAGYKTDAEKLGWAFAWSEKNKWDKVNGTSWKSVGFEQTDDHPVVCVSWNDASAFCKWLGKKTGRAVRLPTEAEWEYACRAGTKTAYWWADERDGGAGCCNAADKTGRKRFRGWRIFRWEDGHVFTAPVASYKANAFGLHDMHGNVWEWCGDRYAGSYAKAAAVDPKGPEKGKRRVVRGGSWLSSPGRCRSAFRAGCNPLGSYCDFIVGFRVVAETK